MIDALRRVALRSTVLPVFLIGLIISGPVAAQSVADGIHPYLEYRKRIQNAESLSTLDTGLFGEGVSLYDGSTQFRVVEIDLPGNSNLPVQFARRLNMQLQPQGSIRDHDARLLGLGNWDVEVPHVAVTYANSTGLPARVCTVGSVPGSGIFNVREFWSGLNVHLPGRGDTAMLGIIAGTPLPTAGTSTRLTTKERDAIDCITMDNGSRDGFRLTTTSGERYYFNQLTTRREAPLQKLVPTTRGNDPVSVILERTRYYLLATRLEDRFGNWVQFSYNGEGLPTRIWSNDGREIGFVYSQGRMTSATANGRSWGFQYQTTLAENLLTKVTRPDGSSWRYAYSGTLLPSAPLPIDTLPGLPWCRDSSLPLSADYVVTATHPAGATGTFSFVNQRHWRHGVHLTECMQKGDPREDPEYVLGVPHFFDVLSIVGKAITGPGLSTMQWTYDYGNSPSDLWGSQNEPAVYPCATCIQTKVVQVRRPDATTQKLTFGNLYMLNDGRELREEVLDAQGRVVQTRSSDYLADASAAGQPFIGEYGAILGSLNDPATVRVRPVTRTQLQQDDTTYTWQAAAYDRFARPVERVRTGPSGSVRERLDYHDNTVHWVLGQLSRVTDLASATIVAEAAFDANAMPVETFAFGKRTQTRTYHADGTVASVRDGNGNTTKLSEWRRGIPGLVQFADATTSRVVVDENGWIASATDESGFATSYGYDAMGRVASVVYPAGDAVNWTPMTRVFQQVGAEEYGIPAGHWRQDIATGNGRLETIYDALWRPVFTREYDAANIAETQRLQRFSYDHEGRLLFASYPGRGANLTTGNWSEYDTLGRRTAAIQDSELGTLVTVTEYLPGARIRVTDARGKQTQTSFQAFDKPAYTAPIAIVKPTGVVLDIPRNVFGNPVSVTQRSSDGSVSLTRRYVYDMHQRLCKSIEPETGATTLGYDASDNILWSATGMNLPAVDSCDASSAYSSGRRVDRGYDARNRLRTLTFPDGNGDQQWVYTPDGLPQQVTTRNAINTSPVVNTYVYNRRRLLVGESATIAGAFNWALGYGYDARGVMASIQYPSGLSVDLAPNGLGQITRVGGFALGVSYHPNGGMRAFTYGNGIVHGMTQNARQLPGRVTDSAGVLDDVYSYDGGGNVTRIEDVLDAGRNRTMQYDDLDRLTRASSARFGGDGVMTYSYDALDNLRSARLAGVKDHIYWYDSNNRLTNVQSSDGATTMGLGYDVQGNLATRNGQAFRFDFGNRLREAEGAEKYAYDAHGRRVLSQAPGGDILSLYDSAGVLRRQENQRTGEGTEYIHLNGSLLAKSVTAMAPGVPVITAPSFSSTGSFTVGWSSVVGVSTYELQQRTGQGGWLSAYSGSALAWSTTGKPAGSHGLRIRACRAVLCGGWSAEVTVVVELAPTAAPTITAPASATGGNYIVGWTAVAGATSYRLEEQKDAGAWGEVQNSAERSRSFSAKPGGTYGYRARGCNTSGCGVYSQAVTVKSVHLPTSAPALNAPAKVLGSAYSINWNAVSNATSYQLDERFNGGGWATISSAAAVSYAASGRAHGVYEYRVRGCASVGCGPYSGVSAVQVVIAPAAAPSISSPASSNTGSYTVNWSSVDRATSYLLQEQINGGGFGNLQNDGSQQRAVSGRSNATYGYRVAACNEAGCSVFSPAAVTAVNIPPPIPEAPVLLEAWYYYSEGHTTYQGGWTEVAGATRYEFSGTAGCVATLPFCSVVVRGMPKITAFRVVACNASGCSRPSNELVVQDGFER
ncbi:RHS repeat protein [Stenotrophomonas maltophilia]|nr:RHS repeat protein [Stenotrophomonas maltophilia]MBA0469366.1 RHS repeat protein [Stenotrophomonas maltophilia]MBA0476934.1 RHS repeat protein [Stenotrophomonas maltophilia]MBA0485422.1 RHS repeat protein [Stenotrophomonas maltophilia]